MPLQKNFFSLFLLTCHASIGTQAAKEDKQINKKKLYNLFSEEILQFVQRKKAFAKEKSSAAVRWDATRVRRM